MVKLEHGAELSGVGSGVGCKVKINILFINNEYIKLMNRILWELVLELVSELAIIMTIKNFIQFKLFFFLLLELVLELVLELAVKIRKFKN